MLMERFSQLPGYEFEFAEVKQIHLSLVNNNADKVRVFRKLDEDDLNDIFPDDILYRRVFNEIINSRQTGEDSIFKYFYDYYSDKVDGHIKISRLLIKLFMRMDSPLSMASPIPLDCPQGIDPYYLYGHLIDHLVQGGLVDEAKVLLLRIHWSIGVLRNRSIGLLDLQKQYELVLQSPSERTDLDDTLQICYKSIILSSSFMSSHKENTKLVNSFILNQIGRLRSCELVKNATCPLQVYLDECFDWWKDNHKYIPHMYRLPSPEGKCLG